MIYNEPTTRDKMVPIVCGVILLAFLATVPSMINNKNKRLEQAWQEQGCQMYDNYHISEVPAKCQAHFIDHYQPQPARPQPIKQGKNL